MSLHELANFLRLAMPKMAAPWSVDQLAREAVKIGAKVVSQGRYVTFQMPRWRFRGRCSQKSLSLIARLRATTRARMNGAGVEAKTMKGGVRFDTGQTKRSSASAQSTYCAGVLPSMQ